MRICLDSPDVKDFRLRIVVAAASSRNRRFSPATFIVTTGRRSQRSIGISSFLSWVWARSDPTSGNEKDPDGDKRVDFMEPPFQIDRPLTGLLYRRTDLACPFAASCFREAGEAV